MRIFSMKSFGWFCVSFLSSFRDENCFLVNEDINENKGYLIQYSCSVLTCTFELKLVLDKFSFTMQMCLKVLLCIRSFIQLRIQDLQSHAIRNGPIYRIQKCTNPVGQQIIVASRQKNANNSAKFRDVNINETVRKGDTKCTNGYETTP